MAEQPDTRTLLAFVGVAVIGGGNAVSIKIGLAEIDPLWSAAVRFLASSLLLFALMVLFRHPFPRRRALAGASLFGTLNFGLAFAFIYYALTDVTAGTTQVAIALTPIFVVVLSSVHRIEPLRGRSVAGSLIALMGTTIIFLDSIQSAPVLKLLALLAAVLCFAEAAVTIKRFPRISPLSENAIGQGVGGAILLVLSLAMGETFAVPVKPATIASLTFLVLFGSMILFGLYVFMIKRWTASAGSYALVVMPVFTVIFANILLDEAVTPLFFVGSAAIVVGVYVGVLSRSARRASD